MKTLLAALALGMMALPAHAIELERVVLLGQTKLSRTGSTKTLRAPACRQGERMDAIRIAVRNQPAFIQQVGIQFKNGRTQFLNIRQEFPRNSRTRWIDLRRKGHCITAVQVSGQSTNLLQKATVEIHGRTRNNNGGGWPGGGGNGSGWPEDDGYDDDDYRN